ncbi:MAG TPA: AraC family transcriptional regulator [Thermoanaerobaculia bacterium]|nr:AraC family transcriptional regulator [Thermoanaerobaculia bacterium]
MKTINLFESRQLLLYEYLCARQRNSNGAVPPAVAHEVAFVRRGMFVVRANGREHPATPNHLLLVPLGSEYFIDHPIDGGDECLITRMSPEVFEEHFGRATRAATYVVTSATFLATQRVRNAAARGQGGAANPLEVEELLLDLLRSAATDVGGSRSTPYATMRERRAVRLAQQLIAERFAEHLPLFDLAEACGLSPTHLSRTFHRVTGVRLHRYQNTLRLRTALKRLAEGERNLTTLALDLGFSDHSHFTSAFRREYGLPPSQARQTG